MCLLLQYSKTVGVYWGELARVLSDSLVLPLNTGVYAEQLENLVNELDAGYGDLMRKNGITLGKFMVSL